MNTPGVDDWELIRRARAGSRRDFDALVHRHYPLVVNVCYRIVLDSASADDAAQEVFIKLYDALASIDDTGTPLAHWLCRVATNHCKNVYRRRKLENRLFSPLDDDLAKPGCVFDKDQLARVEDREAVRRVNRALATVNMRDRTAFVLATCKELTTSEIAAILRITENAVRRRVTRCRDRVLKVLRQEQVYERQRFGT